MYLAAVRRNAPLGVYFTHGLWSASEATAILRSMTLSQKDPSRTRLKAAANVRRLRREQGMTQEALAERAGLHPTYISTVESGDRNVTLDSLERLAKALGVKPFELLV